jgi:hypothetical protein
MKVQLESGAVSPLIVYLERTGQGAAPQDVLRRRWRIAEMKVVTFPRVTKQTDDGLWTPQEIGEAMKPGAILMPE